MQLESLKVFCDLAETKSFTKAAQLNQVTQSAVSQQISALEKLFFPRRAGELKNYLIERSRKKFHLTREGQVLYDYSQEVLATYPRMQSHSWDLDAPQRRLEAWCVEHGVPC